MPISRMHLQGYTCIRGNCVGYVQFSSAISFRKINRTPTQLQKPPPIPRPVIEQDVSEEDWTSFISEWENYKRCTKLADDQLAGQLYHCCEKSLARLILREQLNIVSQGEQPLLLSIKSLAVVKIATSVRRTNLLAMKQSVCL